MGYLPDLDIEGDTPTGSTLDYMSMKFVNEITETNFYMNLEQLLTNEELEIIRPHYRDDRNWDIIDSKLLYSAFSKIYSFLVDNKETIPMYHEIYTKDDNDNGCNSHDENWFSSISFKENDYGYNIYGNILDINWRYDIFPELLEKDYNIKYHKYFNVFCYYKDSSELNQIKAEHIIKVGSKKFKTRSKYKYQQYQSEIEDIIRICQKAISLNKGVIWKLI